ncbi:hypothetical protein CCMA1212_007144 [Trichoderma ghanense]|uniref:Uncharacterized protein n=1 Tax=Trichoderma ghanense TaxID=65468 RepID=A0ABY2GYC5_9HYPO
MPKHSDARFANRKASQPAVQAQAAATPSRAEHQCRASMTCAWPTSCVRLPETDSLALPLIPGSWTGTANGQASHFLNRSTPCHLSPRSAPLVRCPALPCLAIPGILAFLLLVAPSTAFVWAVSQEPPHRAATRPPRGPVLILAAVRATPKEAQITVLPSTKPGRSWASLYFALLQITYGAAVSAKRLGDVGH